MSQPPDIELNPSELAFFYAKYFVYYNSLDEAYKQLFVERCLVFITNKVIGGAGEFEADNRVKCLVAASAVQLTLGLNTWDLSYFDEIEIHPSDFDDRTGTIKYKGETNLHGLIKLSWESFVKGYQVGDDNLNLGIHEFSHALRLNGIRGHTQDYFVENYFNKWLVIASEAFRDTRQNKGSIFRKYGGTNLSEFISVCFEHYFESPEEIKEKYPLLFYATGILLNQVTLQGITELGIRNRFFGECTPLLPGFSNYEAQSSFKRDWTFKLWLLVFLMTFYNGLTAGFFNALTLGLSLVFVAIYVLYDYQALRVKFNQKEVSIQKGAWLFKNRKSLRVQISQITCVSFTDDELTFLYYNKEDDYFLQEKTTNPNGGRDVFIKDCKANKIAVLK